MAYKRRKSGEPVDKLLVLKGVVTFIGVLIIFRLFYLQVVRHDYYQQIAAKEHYGETELPARRGEIFVKDYSSNEPVRVATNVTLDTLFVDPTIITNPKLVADRLAPIIYDVEEARKEDQQRVETEHKRAKTEEDVKKIKSLTDEELYKKFSEDLLNDISQKVRSTIILSNDASPEVMEKVKNLGLVGIEVTEKNILAYPDKLTNSKGFVAAQLATYLEMSPSRLEQILEGKNRYVILKKKIKPEISAQIQKLIEEDKDKNFFGIGLKEEYYRYYPEASLAANVLGFVTPDGIGNYGIESKYNTQLQGKKGIFQGEKDGLYGRQITVGDSVIKPAVDGDNIVLTIDRSMQMVIEKKLAKAVEDYRADSGQVVVMDPNTGYILAMAHYPSFDPNNFSAVTNTDEVNFTADEIKNLTPIEGEDGNFWFYRNVPAHDRYKVMSEIIENGQKIYKRYKNWIGLEAYQNKIVSAPYEPGSVFKAITMASAIDDKDVTADTAFNDPGFLNIDFNVITGKHDSEPIENVSAKCTGYVNMTHVLSNSCNTGLSWIAKRMGKTLFYSYIIRFGFNERTGIEFDNEHPGNVAHYNNWHSESDFLTKSFGQGLTVTPLQMVTAYAAIANGGKLMQPHIVDKIIQDNGKVIQTEPMVVQQVISEQTAHTITAMLVNAVENGVARNAALPNYYLAGKTGTSQTYLRGKAMTGAGTTLASIAGFGPIDNPKFVLYVKFDRPRTSEWADATAVYLYRDIAAYLYEYMGIPPDKK
ncbi:penicillin-binding protein 2 [Candidatus Peregrinibacteria bacterium]|nr:penicillin-binding protein 2 [Candidatus Peregrinibacteria bacterium]